MKKLKLLLALLLIIPVGLTFSACKKNKNNNNNNSNNDQEQGGETPKPIDPDVPTYTVTFDYNLPDRLEGLLENQTITRNVGDSVNLPTIKDDNLKSYFTGWYDTNEEEVTSSISGTEDQQISIKAKWNRVDLNNYYCTSGLEFDYDSDNTASVTGYTGSSEVVYLPVYSMNGSVKCLVDTIKESAFAQKNVKKVNYELTSLTIENEAFKNSKLEEFDFTNVVFIGNSAFSGVNLKNVTLGALVSGIGTNVFEYCKLLETVDFSKPINADFAYIPEYAFSNCDALKTFVTNNNIKTIKTRAFYGCKALESLTFLENNQVTKIEDYAFSNCEALEEIIMPSSLTAFGYNVFDGCSGAKILKLGSLFATENKSFSNYVGDLSKTVEEVYFTGTKITKIPSYCFQNYELLKKVVMSNSIKTLSSGAFRGCLVLDDITFSTQIEISNFATDALETTKWYNDLTQPFVYNNTLMIIPSTLSGEIVIEDGVKEIKSNAFYENTKITKITIPASVQEIGESAFFGCTNLTAVVFESGSKLTKINKTTFYRCNLQSINIPNVTEIGDSAFGANAISMDTLVLPSSLQTLGSGVFSGCEIKEYVITNCDKYCTRDGVLFEKTGDTYKLLVYPKNKTANVYYIEEDVSSIDTSAFHAPKNLEVVYFKKRSASSGESLAFSGSFTRQCLVLSEGVSVSVPTSSYILKFDLLSDDCYSFTAPENEGDYPTISITSDDVSKSDDIQNYFIKRTENSVTKYYTLRVSYINNKYEVSSINDITYKFD